MPKQSDDFSLELALKKVDAYAAKSAEASHHAWKTAPSEANGVLIGKSAKGQSAHSSGKRKIA